MERSPLDEVHVDELLERTLDTGCRELHLASGQVPAAQGGAGHGDLSEYSRANPLQVQQMVYAILTDEQIGEFEREQVLLFSYPLRRRATFNARVTYSGNDWQAIFTRADSA